MRCRILLGILILTGLPFPPFPSTAETLEEVLNASGIDWRTVPISNVEKDVTSDGVLNDSRSLCIADYLATGTPSLSNQLNIAGDDKGKRIWDQHEIHDEKWIRNESAQLEAVTRISQSGDCFFLDTYLQ